MNARKILAAASLCAALATFPSCTSMGTLGIITKSEADPVSIFRHGRSFKEIGPTEGSACKYMILSIVPWGKSDLQTAVDRALKKSGGDALINVSVANSLYSFLPVYSILSVSCTAVKGIAVGFEPSGPASLKTR